MMRGSFIEQLEAAANETDDLDASSMLRRAALRLQATAGVPLPVHVFEALHFAAVEMDIEPRELISQIVEEWLLSTGYLAPADEPE